MLTVKLSEILSASGVRNQNTPEQESIGLAKVMELKLSAKLAYRFSKLAKEIDSKKEAFQKQQQELFEKYGEKVLEDEVDEDGSTILDENGSVKKKETGQIQLTQENVEKFNKELNDLLNEPETINYFPISIQMLENDDIRLSPSDMFMLQPFIIDEDDETETSCD